MKRSYKRYLKFISFWILCLSLCYLASQMFLTDQTGVNLSLRMLKVADINKEHGENTKNTNKHTNVMRESFPTKPNKVRLLSEWQFEKPAVTMETNVSTTEKVDQPDDVILLLGRPRSKPGFLTIGLCTVPRKGASYLSLTLSRMIGGMKIRDKKDVVIVIFLASDDSVWLEETIKNIQFTYNDDIDSGLILVVQPKQHIYPDFRICGGYLNHRLMFNENIQETDNTITKRTFNDAPSRVHWRTKQNIDYAYLFSYSRNISQFYMQIEDDVLAADNFIFYIRDFITKSESKPWFCLEFSSLGFIGKLFHSESLIIISDFLLIFKTEQPCDLLLNHLKRIMNQHKDLRIEKSLFQHQGVISSLENKTQPLTDVSFRDNSKHKLNIKTRKIQNPPARITTNLDTYKSFSPDKPYLYTATEFFWCKPPPKGGYYNIEFDNPVNLTHIYIQTGHPFRNTDKLEQGNVLLGLEGEGRNCGKIVTIAKFVLGKVDINTQTSFFPPNINCLIIHVTEDQRNWLIIREIGLY